MKKLFKSIKWKIEHFIDYIRYDIPQGITSIIKWLPVTWQDRHWDDSYIYTVLEYKIKETAKLHARHKRYIGWEASVDRMNTAVKLMQLLRDEEAEDKMYEEFEKKWGEGDFKFEKSDKEGFFEMIIVREGVKTEEDEEQSSNDYRKMMDDARELHAKRKRLLFKILEYNIEKWWD